MAPTERIRVRISTRPGVSPRQVLDAIRDYPARTWEIRSRRPLVLAHVQRRAKGVRFTFKTDGDGVSLLILGGGARLGLGYAATLLANGEFAELISSFNVDLPS